MVGADLELLLSHAGQDTQVSEGQRECAIENRVSGEQTGLGGAEPKGAGSPDSETLYASLPARPPNLLNPHSAA